MHDTATLKIRDICKCAEKRLFRQCHYYCEQLCNFDTFLDHLFRVRKMEKKAQSDLFLPIFHPADSYALGNDLVLS